MSVPRLRRSLVLAVVLAVSPGCSWVHDRQPLLPNRVGGRLEGRPVARERAPRVNLRVDPAVSEPVPVRGGDRVPLGE